MEAGWLGISIRSSELSLRRICFIARTSTPTYIRSISSSTHQITRVKDVFHHRPHLPPLHLRPLLPKRIHLFCNHPLSPRHTRSLRRFLLLCSPAFLRTQSDSNAEAEDAERWIVEAGIEEDVWWEVNGDTRRREGEGGIGGVSTSGAKPLVKSSTSTHHHDHRDHRYSL